MPAKAQQKRQALQLSGVVVSADSTEGIAGIAVYVPGTNRGTITKADGFFTFAALPGDSVVFQALGFEKQYIILPQNDDTDKYFTKVKLKQVARQLPEVQVMPWATQQDFKVAVRDLALPEEPSVKPDLGPLYPKSIFATPPMDARDNSRQGLKHHLNQQQGRFILPTQIRIF